ncbi:MAG: S41 family peptidase [Anaerolineales bacterium]|nr:S41 family peptidase [Anaerolineales bacterium]
MRTKIQIPIILFTSFVLLAGVFGAGFATALVINRHQNPVVIEDSFALFWEVWDLIEQDFFGELPDETELTYNAIRGSLDTLDDPYTVFIEPQPREMERDSLRGSFGGIGAVVSQNENGEIVLSPIEGQPAILAGILEGDVVLAVDGQPVEPSMTVDDVVTMIRGPVDKEVTLKVRHPNGETGEITIVRAVIELPSASWEILDDEPTIGYIYLTRFTERSAEELETAINELQAEGAEKLVLDLRYNGGGLLQSAVDVLDIFVDNKVVLYQLSSGGAEISYKTDRGGLALEVPLVVLVNGGTASASEIVAGALQDLERAVLVGEKTFGKGSVQHVFDLRDGSSLHVTSARWFTPGRQQLDGNGLEPDIPLLQEDVEKDLQLERAVDFLMTGQ